MGALAVLLAGLIPALSRAQPAPAVEITPNAILKLGEPMRVKVTGSKHTTLYAFILRSCDSNPATPELRSRGDCKTPLWRKEVSLDHRGQWHYELLFTELAEQPVDEQLWLRVSPDPHGRGPYGQTIFTVRGNGSCSLGKTFVGLFTGGLCAVGKPLIIIPHPFAKLDQVPFMKLDRAPLHLLMAVNLYHELDERLSLGAFYDVGLCVGGDGCATTYNDFGIEGLYSAVNEDSIAMAVRMGVTFHAFNPFAGGLHAGLPARFQRGELAVLSEPSLYVEIFEREARKDVLALLMQLQYQLTDRNALLLTSGMSSLLSGFGDGFAVPLGMGTLVALSRRVDMGGEFLFTNLAGRNGGVDGRVLLLRLALR